MSAGDAPQLVRGLRLPIGISVLKYPDGQCRARCQCDWTGPLRESAEWAAEVDADSHARSSAWCHVHRSRTPIGADPTYP